MPFALQAAPQPLSSDHAVVAARGAIWLLARSAGIQIVDDGSCNAGSACCIRVVNRRAFYSRLTRGFSLGLGEGYVAGDWDSDQLLEVLRRLAGRLVWLARFLPFQAVAYL